jgi:protein SCO1/2
MTTHLNLDTRAAVGLILAMLGIAACGCDNASTASGGERQFAATGLIVAVLEGGQVSVAHEAIPDFMPAMTMPLTLADRRDAGRLRPGDRVQFTLRVSDQASRAADVVVTGRDERALAAYAAARSAPSARLRPGDVVPVFRLVDQAGTPITGEDLRGHPTVLTFLFTRCPLPEFCPRIVGHFKQLQRAIAADPSLAAVRLLSISLDPEFDSPQVLSEYGRAMGADFTRWRFATGALDQVAVLTRAFAVHTERTGPLLDHTLATALIDAEGRVVELWRGTGWTAEDVLGTLRARAPAD